MFSIKNDPYKVVYFLNPKCACTSIRSIIIPTRPHALKNCDANKFKNYFWFSFVRNPLDRVVSLYCYIKQKKQLQHTGTLMRMLGIDRNITFHDFVKVICDTDDNDSDIHWESQTRLLPLNQLDFVGRFENIAHDWKLLQLRTSIPDLPKLCSTVHKPFKSYYTKDLEHLVKKRYENDMDILRYT